MTDHMGVGEVLAEMMRARKIIEWTVAKKTLTIYPEPAIAKREQMLGNLAGSYAWGEALIAVEDVFPGAMAIEIRQI